MNEQLRELTLKKFINGIENLRGNDLECALNKLEYCGTRISDVGESFHNWIGDAFRYACDELELDMDEIQESDEYMNGYYDDDCHDYIEELAE